MLYRNDKEFLEELKKYIEDSEERSDDEFGYRSAKELREVGLMPFIYEEVLARLDK